MEKTKRDRRPQYLRKPDKFKQSELKGVTLYSEAFKELPQLIRKFKEQKLITFAPPLADHQLRKPRVQVYQPKAKRVTA